MHTFEQILCHTTCGGKIILKFLHRTSHGTVWPSHFQFASYLRSLVPRPFVGETFNEQPGCDASTYELHNLQKLESDGNKQSHSKPQEKHLILDTWQPWLWLAAPITFRASVGQLYFNWLHNCNQERLLLIEFMLLLTLAVYVFLALEEQVPKGNFVQFLQVEFHSTLQSYLHSLLTWTVWNLKWTYSSV